MIDPIEDYIEMITNLPLTKSGKLIRSAILEEIGFSVPELPQKREPKARYQNLFQNSRDYI